MQPSDAVQPSDAEDEPPLAFERRFVPKWAGWAVAVGRAGRRWRALGPRLGHYSPRSTLELPGHVPERAAVPAVNFHAHLGRWLSGDGSWTETSPDRLLQMMDERNIEATINLDGRWGAELEANLDRYDRAHPGRFFTFCHVDWRLLDRHDGPRLLVESLQRSIAAGARGLKVWKDLGTKVKARGRLVLPDDPLLEALWEEAGNLGIPVVAHVADPMAFFEPVGPHNERLEELLRHPGNSLAHEGMGQFHRLLGSLEHVVSSHPRTTVVAAHGFHAENVGHVASMMDRYPNFHIDIAWAHLQLGRQPRAARALVVAHPDRVLFGTDVFPLRSGIFPIYFRFLETADESFSYTDEVPPGSGRWPIYGLDLPGDVLAQVYRDNAVRLLGL